MTPTPIQAQTLWFHALGMDVMDIASATGRTASSVRQAISEAQRKATASGLRIVVIRPEVDKTQSGLSAARQLAKEAGLI